MARWALLFGIVVCAILAGGSAPRASTRAADGDSFVVVRLASAAALRAQAGQGASEGSLYDEGYRRLPVPAGQSPAEYLARLKADPDVLSAELDARVSAATVPNDPFYGGNQAAYMDLIRAPAGWDIATGNGRPTLVAVLDSGLDVNHPEFGGRLWENLADADGDGNDDDGNGCIDDHYGCRFVELTNENRAGCGYTSPAPRGDIRDDNGRAGSADHSHGTYVSGIIGASGNNGAGVTGVAWNVQLMTVKVLDCGPGGRAPNGFMFNVAEGIRYARLNGARVISLSLASAPGDTNADISVLRDELKRAEDAGIIIVAAAGNHRPGTTQVAPGYPGAYTQFTNLVTVGASDLGGQFEPFSNYGPAIDLAAPGVSIASTVRSDVGVNPPYLVFSQGGTSFATPLVAGMFALMISRNPNLATAEYVEIAKAAARPAPAAPHGQNWAGAGIIDIGAALGRIPLALGGVALRDFLDVPADTEIRAFVGNTECGTTRTQQVGPISRYTLRVRAEAETPGCGAVGRSVSFLIGGLPAQETVPWPARDEVMGGGSRELTTVSPPPGPIVIQPLNGRWSNVAILEAGGRLPGALSAIPSQWGHALRWDPEKQVLEEVEGAYRHYSRDVPEFVNDLPGVERYDAIWVDAGQASLAMQNPEPPPGRVVQLKAGWNNFVWTGSTRAASDGLASISGKYSRLLQFDNSTEKWLEFLPGRPRYQNDFAGLFQLRVYWIYVTEDVALKMD